MRLSTTTSAALAVVALAACGGAKTSRPVIRGAGTGPAEPAAIASVEAEVVLDLGESYLAAQAAWRQANRSLASTDYDQGWSDLDGFERQLYVEAAQQIVTLGEAGAEYDGALSPRAAAIARYLDGEEEPTDRIGGEVDGLLDDVRRVTDRLARAATPAGTRACLAARFALAQAIVEHGHAIEEARVTSSMAVNETGLPPGSVEQLEAVEEYTRLTAELDEWETGLARAEYAAAAIFELAPLPAMTRPGRDVPELLEGEWPALERTIAAARSACAAVTPRAD